MAREYEESGKSSAIKSIEAKVSKELESSKGRQHTGRSAKDAFMYFLEKIGNLLVSPLGETKNMGVLQLSSAANKDKMREKVADDYRKNGHTGAKDSKNQKSKEAKEGSAVGKMFFRAAMGATVSATVGTASELFRDSIRVTKYEKKRRTSRNRMLSDVGKEGVSLNKTQLEQIAKATRDLNNKLREYNKIARDTAGATSVYGLSLEYYRQKFGG